MVLESAVNSLTHLALRDKVRNDDGIDQLHHFVTVAILAFFGAVTGLVEYAAEPINCWNHGVQLMKHFQDHVNRYCWAQPLYHYPDETNHSVVPYMLNAMGAPEKQADVEAISDSGKVTFFRWVTIIFLIQAFLFKLPNLMWSELNTYSGSNIIKMVEMLESVVFTTKEEKKTKLQQVALFLEQWLRIHRKPGRWFLRTDVSPMVKKTLSVCMGCVGNNLDNYLSTSYLIIKGLFLLNILLQFLLLSIFLQLNFWHFGVETLKAYEDVDIYQTSTKTFPVVSLCHFQTYEKGGGNGYWVQCILTINIFQEKLFLIEWFWLLILLFLTIINFFVWMFRILQTGTSLRFIDRYMRLMKTYENLDVPPEFSVEQFVTEYLRSDGVFIIRILAVNTNEVVVAQLVEQLWKRTRHCGIT